MPIASSDILLKLSVKAGTAGNQNAGTPSGSLGRYVSTTQVVDNSLHNLFDVVSGAENLAAESEYRCIFVHNNHGTLTFLNVKAYIAAETAGGASIALGVDPTAASALGATTAQAVEVVDENAAPSGVAFTAPVDYASAVTLGDIAPGQVKAVWIRRTTANTTALANDGFTLRLQGESL